MRVDRFLLESAARLPGKTALVCGQERLTYRELAARSRAVAQHLTDRGVVPGDRIVICLDNTTEATVSIFAAAFAGAAFVVMNPTTKPERLAFILGDCRAKALLTNQDRFQAWKERAGGALYPAHVILEDELRTAGDTGADAALPPDRSEDDLAAIIYTSGSTGEPKGVMLSHRNMTAAADSVITYLENNEQDVVVNVLPLSYSYGVYQLLTMVKVGGTLVLERSFAFPFGVIERMMAEKATGFPLIPFIAAKLLQMDLAKYRMPHLRYVTNAAAALSVRDLLALKAALPGTKIFSMYGVSECKRVSYLPPEQIEIRPESVGRGIPGQEHMVVDEDFNPVPPGVPGELIVHGGHVMQGYWERPAETARALRKHPVTGKTYLFTGDLFRTDAEGYLYFVARKDDIIKTRGEKVSPREVEEVLYRLEGVQEAAVVGVPDDMLGFAIKAVITLKPGASLTAKDVLRHCAMNLENHMVPKHIAFMDELPKTASGKVLKKALAATGS